MKYTRIYDSCYKSMLIGYSFDGGVIYRDARTSWRGNDILDGYEVVVDGKRVFYAGTLKEAKAWVEERFAEKEEASIPQEVKTEMFEKMLSLEHLAEATTYDGRDYNEQADGAFQMLQILGLGSEYINWAIGK